MLLVLLLPLLAANIAYAGTLSVVRTPEPKRYSMSKAPNGHFYTSGAVNSFPVTFMIDTGATFVALPLSMIRNTGIKRCVKRTSSTANGKTTGCMAMASVRIGPYTIKKTPVSFLPNLTTPLMGMNVLNRFHMSTSRNSLEISVK